MTKELLVVHFAILLVKSTEPENGPAESIDLAATKAADQLGLTPKRIFRINKRVKEMVKTGISAFY